MNAFGFHQIMLEKSNSAPVRLKTDVALLFGLQGEMRSQNRIYMQLLAWEPPCKSKKMLESLLGAASKINARDSVLSDDDFRL